MRRCAASLLILVFGALGCIERRMVVVSDPPGALVLHNGQPIGNAPADDHFIYYGIHHFTIIRPGYQTLQVDQRIRAPWYQFFPLDFVTEGLLPFQIEDVRRFTYQLQPVTGVRPEEISDRAKILRDRGKAIAEPSPEGESGGWGRRRRNAPAQAGAKPPAGSPVGSPVPPASPPPPAGTPFMPAQPGAPFLPPEPPPIIGSGPLGQPGISPPPG